MIERPQTLRDSELSPGIFLFPSGWEGKIRGLTTADEDKLRDRRLWKTMQAMDEIVRLCVEGPEEKTKDMLIGDALFALVQIRRISYGDEYEIKVQCSNCGRVYIWQEDLGTLPVRYLEDENETREIILPVSKKKVTWKLLRQSDDRKLMKLNETVPNELTTNELLVRIIAIEGEQAVTRDIIRQLPVRDVEALRQDFEERDCGVDMLIYPSCPYCDFEEEIPLPIQPAFFPFMQVTRRKQRSLK